jgi:hypothetical protein
LLSQFAPPAQENRLAQSKGRPVNSLGICLAAGWLEPDSSGPNCRGRKDRKELESMAHTDHRGRNAGPAATVAAGPRALSERAASGRFSRGRGAKAHLEAAHG